MRIRHASGTMVDVTRADVFDALREAFALMWRPSRWWGWVLVFPIYPGLALVVLGYALRDSRNPAGRRPVAPTSPGSFAVAWLVPVLAAPAGGLGWWLGVEQPMRKAEGAAATSACRGFVLEQVRSPGTAAFSSESWTGDVTTGRFTILGTVDSENYLGSTSSAGYRCVVQRDGDAWRLVSMTSQMSVQPGNVVSG